MASPEQSLADLSLQKRIELPPHKLNVGAAFAIFAVFIGIFAAITVVDVLRSGIPWTDYHGGAAAARAFATTVSRGYNVILGMVISAIALAIPITANMYTPKLVEMFVKDRYTVGVIAFFVFSCAHAIWVTYIPFDGPPGTPGLWPRISIYLILFEMLFGFAIMMPYLQYASGFLNPSNIIRRVTDQIIDEFADIERGIRPVPVAQTRLAQRILHLGNVILRAVDRADRDVALEAIRSLERVSVRYSEIAKRLPEEWYDVGTDILTGLSEEAVAITRREHNWVEHRCLTQLSLAYNASLAKMPDAVSAISDVMRAIGINAERAGDRGALALTVRFFNTFVREAVKRKDVHAIYDLYTQYKSLVRELMPLHPELLVEAGRYFKYYADFARGSGMSFIYEFTSYELGEMVSRAYERGVPTGAQALDIMLSLEGVAASPRLVKSRAILWAFFTARGAAAEADRLRLSLRGVPPATLESARQDLLQTTEAVFWEVTDRQTNFDYVPDDRKALVKTLLDGLAQEAAAPPAPAPAPRPAARVA